MRKAHFFATGIFANISWSFFSVIVNASAQFVQIALLARTVEPEAFAVLGVVNVVFALFLIVSDFGLVNYQLANKKFYNEFSSLIPFVCILIGVGSSLLCFLLAQFIGWFYNNQTYESAVMIVSLAFFFNSLCSFWYGKYSLKKDLSIIGKVEVLARSISFTIFLLSINYIGVFASIISIVIFFASKCFLFCLYDSSFFYGSTNPFSSVNSLKKILKYSLKQVSSQWLGQLAANLDSIILSKYFDSYWFGLYSAGKDLALKTSMLLNPVVARVCTPYLADLKGSMRDNYLKVSNILLFVTLVGFSVLLLSSKILVNLLFEDSYSELHTLLPLLFLWAFLRMNCAVASSALVVSGRVGLELIWNISSVLFWSSLLLIVAKESIFTVVNTLIGGQFFVTMLYIILIQKLVLSEVIKSPLVLISFAIVTLYGVSLL